MTTQFFYKRSSFQHEQEFRLWHFNWRDDAEDACTLAQNPNNTAINLTPGLEIEVDLKMLLESVYICPTKDKWFLTTVEAILGKLGLDATKVVPSRLSEEPVWPD